MSEICLPLGLDKQGLVKLEAMIKNSAVQHSGEIAVHQGDPFRKVYAVKSGMYKSSRVDESGNESVLGFHLPGELFGLDAIYPQQYTCTTTALDTAVLCEMDYEQLTRLCSTIPELQRQLLRLLSRDIHVAHVIQVEQSEQTAEQKLASFLHNLSTRYKARGHSATDLVLAMARQDIASYLGMAPETISRLLKRFQQKGILVIHKRQVTIVEPTILMGIIHCEGVQAS
ncbi:MAG: cyclic nucleotide-binding domain-containing protein [Arenicella sp.]